MCIMSLKFKMNTIRSVYHLGVIPHVHWQHNDINIDPFTAPSHLHFICVCLSHVPPLPHQLDVFCGAGKSREVGILGDSDASFIETFRQSAPSPRATDANTLSNRRFCPALPRSTTRGTSWPLTAAPSCPHPKFITCILPRSHSTLLEPSLPCV